MSCPDCFRGAIHTHAKPKGTMQNDLYGYKTYVALPPGETSPKSTIFFITDAFGHYLPNNLLLADHYAHATGCRVLVPDIIPGGGAPLWVMHAVNDVFKPIGPTWGSWLNPLTYLSKAYSVGASLVGFLPFIIRANNDKQYPESLRYARAIRADLPADGKLGVAGFCWGGWPSTKLCAEPVTEGSDKPLIDAQFNAHPSTLALPDMVVDAIGKYKVPYSCAVAEFDFGFDKKTADETEAAVKQKLGDGVGTYEFVIWKGCHHGFSVRASFDAGETIKNGYEGAAKQATDWFNKYLK